jgi:hypothetical protein
MKHETFPKIIVRLPPDVKAWVETQAQYNVSSQTSEIVRALRERMERVSYHQQAA